MKHCLSLLLLALLMGSPASGQETRTPIFGWKSIKTEHFEVIFPPGAEEQAQRAAASLEAIYEPLHIDSRRGRRLPVVLSSDGAMSNGYATPMPRHSTFYLNPGADWDDLNHTLNWVDMLAIHEYRHITQFLHAKRGIPRVLSWLVGPVAAGATYSLVLPPWYFEGDAVLMETALTEGGRGRRPAFDVDLRALTAERGVLSYDHYVSGSLKRPMPDHYRFGYHMVSYGREHYGERVWLETTQRAAAWSPLPFVFPLSLRKTTGHALRGFSAQMMHTRAAQWEEQRQKTFVTEAQDLVRPPSDGKALFTRSPLLQPDGSVLAFQEGRAIAPRIVRIHPDGRTEVLAKTGFRLTTRISAAEGLIVWDEIEFDPLRSSQSHSVIRIRRPDGSVSNLTKTGALFSPSLSPDGRRIAAVQKTPENTPALVLLDTNSGEEIWRMDYPVHHWLRTPSWARDGGSIVVAHLHDHEGVGIEQVDIASKTATSLVPASHTTISRPTLSTDFLFYSSSESGLDAIWAQALEDGKRYRVASRPFAAWDPSVDDAEQFIAFADYTYWGTGVQRVPLDPAAWEPAESVTPVFVDTIAPTIAQTQEKVSFGEASEPRQAHRYLRIPRPRDAVMWTLPLDASGGSISLADPTNLMGISLSAGLTENLTPQGSFGIDYRGLPVVLSGEVGTQQRLGSLAEVPETSTESPSPSEFSIPDLNTSWTETVLRGSVSLPVWFRRGAWSRGLQIESAASIREVSNIVADGEPTTAIDTTFGTLESGTRKELSASAEIYQSLQSAPMAIAPSWSQSLRYTHTLTPFGGDLQGEYQAAELELSFPGLAPLHSIQVAASWQNSQGDYTLSPQVFSPRGADLPSEGSMAAGRFAYRLPLAYPDRPLSPLAFLKRVSGGLFYEAGQASTSSESVLIQTAGAELWTEGTLFRLPSDLGLDIGLDVGWRIDTGEPFASVRLLGSTWSSTSSSASAPLSSRLWQR